MRSADEAQRNPGPQQRLAPHCASLHAGYIPSSNKKGARSERLFFFRLRVQSYFENRLTSRPGWPALGRRVALVQTSCAPPPADSLVLPSLSLLTSPRPYPSLG